MAKLKETLKKVVSKVTTKKEEKKEVPVVSHDPDMPENKQRHLR